MKTKLIFSLIALAPLMASAQSFRVEKVKGNRAIVRVSGAPVRAGQTYNVGGGSSMGLSDAAGSRKNILGFEASFSNLTTAIDSSSSASSTLSLVGRFGWNAEVYEYGALGGFSNSSVSGNSSTSYSLGGFFDYNLTPNVPGASSIYGVGGAASIGSTTNSSSGSSSSSTSFQVSGFGKFWILGTSTAIRGDIAYVYSKYNATPSSTVSGFVLSAGLSHYF